MTTPPRTAQRRRRSNVRVSGSRRTLFLFGWLGFLLVLILGGTALLGQQATNRAADTTVRIAEGTTPPSAEPNGRAWGPKDAPITVIEYADYECESCGYFALNYEREFVNTFAATGKVRFEIRNAPFHGEGAENAAQAAYCAADQNTFWAMHDSLFLNQPVHDAPVSAGFSIQRLTSIAAQLGLDTATFGTCLETGVYRQQVQNDLVAAQQANVTGTPTFVINDQVYTGPLSTANFREIFAEVAPDVEFE